MHWHASLIRFSRQNSENFEISHQNLLVFNHTFPDKHNYWHCIPVTAKATALIPTKFILSDKEQTWPSTLWIVNQEQSLLSNIAFFYIIFFLFLAQCTVRCLSFQTQSFVAARFLLSHSPSAIAELFVYVVMKCICICIYNSNKNKCLWHMLRRKQIWQTHDASLFYLSQQFHVRPADSDLLQYEVQSSSSTSVNGTTDSRSSVELRTVKRLSVDSTSISDNDGLASDA